MFYDLQPTSTINPNNRNYNLEMQLGSLYSYLLFQDRFKVDEETWEVMFTQKWFPFTYLDDDLLKQIINHAKNKWNVDELLPKIVENIKKLINESDPLSVNKPQLDEHLDIFKRAQERYLDDDFISCASILYPRLEGLMRSIYRNKEQSKSPSSKILAQTTIEHRQETRTPHSLLLPKKFRAYLDIVYFASFSPGSDPDVGRHSVAHGEARSDDFSQKSSTIGLLILYQLILFL